MGNGYPVKIERSVNRKSSGCWIGDLAKDPGPNSLLAESATN